jgi:hypothetical protein
VKDRVRVTLRERLGERDGWRERDGVAGGWGRERVREEGRGGGREGGSECLRERERP